MKKILLIGSGDSIENEYGYSEIEVVSYRAIQFKSVSFELNDEPAFDWIFFGSKRGAAVLLESNPDLLQRRHVGAVGSGTAAFLKSHGIPCRFVPETYSSRHWPEAFVRQFPDASGVVYPTSDRSPFTCPEVFKQNSIRFQKVVVYRTICDAHPISAFPDVFVFTSPSCYDCFVETHGVDVFHDRRVVAIGDVTRHHIESEGIPCSMPDRFTVRDALDHAVEILKDR